jgi:hypothetical protein
MREDEITTSSRFTNPSGGKPAFTMAQIEGAKKGNPDSNYAGGMLEKNGARAAQQLKTLLEQFKASGDTMAYTMLVQRLFKDASFLPNVDSWDTSTTVHPVAGVGHYEIDIRIVAIHETTMIDFVDISCKVEGYDRWLKDCMFEWGKPGVATDDEGRGITQFFADAVRADQARIAIGKPGSKTMEYLLVAPYRMRPIDHTELARYTDRNVGFNTWFSQLAKGSSDDLALLERFRQKFSWPAGANVLVDAMLIQMFQENGIIKGKQKARESFFDASGKIELKTQGGYDPAVGHPVSAVWAAIVKDGFAVTWHPDLQAFEVTFRYLLPGSTTPLTAHRLVSAWGARVTVSEFRSIAMAALGIIKGNPGLQGRIGLQ